MNAAELIKQLSEMPPDLEVLLSGDPDVFGDYAEAVEPEHGPRVKNVSHLPEGFVAIWPDRSWCDVLAGEA